jgi:aryl-alcohol dehydrogenase-like predicted oxidoreductase
MDDTPTGRRTDMQTVTLGATRLEVTPLAYGTWQFGGDWGPVDEPAAIAAIQNARSAGINFFDTAQAYGLLGGAITETMTFGPGDWRAHSPAFTGAGFARNLKVIAALRAFAARRGATIAQLAVAWVLVHPAVQVAIVGARSRAHLDESLGALDLELSPGDLAEIDQIMAGAVPVGGPSPEGMS